MATTGFSIFLRGRIPLPGDSPRRARWRSLLGALALGVGLVAPPAGAQTVPDVFRTPAERARANANVVGLVTGSPGGLYMPMGVALARRLDDLTTGALRVVVTFGYGSVGNVDDLLNLKGIDFAMVQADVLEAFQNDPETYRRLSRSVNYVTRLHQEEIHVFGRAELTSVRALDGKRVSIGLPGSGTQITARALFRSLGIRPVIVESGTEAALSDLRAGTLDAMVAVVGKGAKDFRALSGEDATRAGLAFVPFVGDEGDFGSYVPASLDAADYPALIPKGESVATRAVPAVLVVYAWRPQDERYQPVRRFIETFFDRMALFGNVSGDERKVWCQVDLTVPVRGWTRFPVAEDWLAQHPDRPTRVCSDGGGGCLSRFEAWLRGRSVVRGPTFSAGVEAAYYDDWRASEGRDCPVQKPR